MDVQPFTIEIPGTTLDDLRRRLEETRWPGEIPGSDWAYGSNLAYVQELVAYWRTGFDWRAQERRLNSFEHYKARVDGLLIHFIHEKGKGPSPVPLVVTHGWPGSFFEMYKTIPLLTDPGSHGGDPADAFDVVVPSSRATGSPISRHSPACMFSRSPTCGPGLWPKGWAISALPPRGAIGVPALPTIWGLRIRNI